MKACLRCFSVVAAFLVTVEFAKCSDCNSERGEVSFAEYSEGRANLRVVLGCGRQHRERTCGGQRHDHEESYTVDLKPLTVQSRNRWDVSDPHRYGNAFKAETWRDIPENSLDDIMTEHLVLFRQPDLVAVRSFRKAGLSLRKAREKAEAKDFNRLIDRAVIHLKPGGTLTLLPAFHGHSSAPFCCKGIFQKLLRYPGSVFPEDAAPLLIPDMDEFFPFDRGFSQMTIRFYFVSELHLSKRKSTFVSEYILNISPKAEAEDLYRNAEMALDICREQSKINFVTLSLTKEGKEE